MADDVVSLDTTNSLVTLIDAKTIIGDNAAETENDNNIKRFINAASVFCNSYTGRKLKSRSLTERYSGFGGTSILLKEYPVTAVSTVAVGVRQPMKIKNASDTTYASVKVASSTMTLNHDGTTNDLAFATYTTLSSLETAINAVGDSWEAEVLNSDDDDFLTSEVLNMMGRHCLDEYAYIDVPDNYISEYTLDDDNGELYIPSGITSGFKNIIVDYTAGYSTIPWDIRDACLQIVLYLWQAYEERRFGLTSRTIADGTMSIETANVPRSALHLLDPYRRRYA
jgi:hypothetical protein